MKLSPHQISRIAEIALNDFRRVVEHYIPGGRMEGHDYVVRNPLRGDKKEGSFRIHIIEGFGKDFGADGYNFGDPVAFVTLIEGFQTQSEGAAALAEFLSIPLPDNNTDARSTGQNRPRPKPAPPKKPVYLAVPEKAPPAPSTHYNRGKPSATWTYHDKDGRILFHVYRFEAKNETERKQIVPLSWAHKENKWEWKGIPAPRPLYKLHLLHQNPDATVILSEGEKAADAAQSLFPNAVTTTPPNGAQSPNQTDWSILKGRVVWIWPDADSPGQTFALKAGELAHQFGAKSVHRFNLKAFVKQSGNEAGELPKGWDAADAVSDGWTASQLATLTKAPSFLLALHDPNKQKPEAKPRAIETPRPHGHNGGDLTPYFEVTDKGVMYYGITFNKQSKEHERASPLWICSPFRVTAYTRDVNSENWGRLLEFKDFDGIPHSWAMGMHLLSGSCEGLRSELLRLGVQISTHQEARRRVEDYIQQERPGVRARCVNRTGWHDGVFVFPHTTLGSEKQERVIFQADSLEGFAYREKGTLDQWKETVSLPSRGNSRLLFSLSVSFASMLLELADSESGGFHFRGDSSTGKTTLLRVASSVFGGSDYMQRWRATDNSLEALAAQHSDTLLLLDELAQVDPKVAGETAYMLANGAGKSRAGRDGNTRARKTWRLLFLSAGEISLSDHMAQAGKRAKAGQELRMADIPADAGVSLGAWEELHGRENGAVLSRELNEASLKNFGTAAPAFIQAVIKNREELPFQIKQLRDEFIKEVLPTSASGQAERVAVRFSLAAIGGELATAYNITGWEPGEATQAAKRCFGDWVKARGGAGNMEHTNILRQVRKFFELHGEARFTEFGVAEEGPAKQRTINRAGFVKQNQLGELEYYVFQEVYKAEICDGYDFREVSKLLQAKGWLDGDSDGRPNKKTRLPGSSKTTRCYVFPLEKMVG